MSIYHDEIEIEDMEYDEETETYYYPCPCGDRFQVTKVKLCSHWHCGNCHFLKLQYQFSFRVFQVKDLSHYGHTILMW